MSKYQITIILNGNKNTYFWNAKNIENVKKNINKKLDFCKVNYPNAKIEILEVKEV